MHASKKDKVNSFSEMSNICNHASWARKTQLKMELKMLRDILFKIYAAAREE
jgi:hypothetical protein